MGSGNGGVRGVLNFEAAIMDRLNAAVIVTDLGGTLLYANPHAERVFGWQADAIGEPTAELSGVHLTAAQAAEIGAALADGRTWEGEFEFTRHDGTKLNVRATDSGLFDDDGQLVGVVSMVVDITEHRESFERLAHEADTLRFLLDVSTALSASLDFRESLQHLAQVVVPVLGDICLIDVFTDGAIARMAAAHRDPSKAALLETMAERYPPDPRGQHPAATVMRTGASHMSTAMDDAFLRATSRDEEHYRMLKELGFHSFMSAPLAARGRTIGALTMVSSGRSFTAEDLALTEDVAQRVSMLLDNARLFSESSHVARALQAALLPPTLPDVPGLQIAARYRAAGEGNEVGGDFYDVFDVGRGAWAAVVGDVCGTGPEAAAVTGLVRHALRASGLQTRDPVAMLRTANALLNEHPENEIERFCTACCAIIRTGRDARVTVASAGHPLPMLLKHGQPVEDIPCKGGLLGVSPDVELRAQRFSLRPGDRLLLYTDGVTEARDAGGHFFADGAFAKVLASVADADVEAVVDGVLRAVARFTGGRPRDDLALLAIGVPPAATA